MSAVNTNNYYRRAKLYSCVECVNEGRTYTQVKHRVVAHIYKDHLALKKAPFYCTLCLIRCNTKEALQNHVSRYSRHRWAATKMGETEPFSQDHCVCNPNPIIVELGKDLVEVPADESSSADQSSDNAFFMNESDFFKEAEPVVNHPIAPATVDHNPIRPGNLIIVPAELLASLLQQSQVPQTQPQQCQPLQHQVLHQNQLPQHQLQQTSLLQTQLPQSQLQQNPLALQSRPAQTPPVHNQMTMHQQLSQITLPATSTLPKTGNVANLHVRSSIPTEEYVPTPITGLPKKPTSAAVSVTSGSPFGNDLYKPSFDPPTTPIALKKKSWELETSVQRSALNTPALSQAGTEDLRPQLFGECENQESLNDLEKWLSNQGDEAGASSTTSTEKETHKKDADEPRPKKTKLDEGDEVEEATDTPHEFSQTDLLIWKLGDNGERMAAAIADSSEKMANAITLSTKGMSEVLADSTKRMAEAMEADARASRGTDKTLQGVLEVLAKVNRNLERIGEELRREHQRKLEENQQKQQADEKGDHRSEKAETSQRKKAHERKPEARHNSKEARKGKRKHGDEDEKENDRLRSVATQKNKPKKDKK